MAVWPALLVAPLLSLAGVSLGHALATPACEAQLGAWLHAVPLALALLSLGCTLPAVAEVRRLRREGTAAPHAEPDRRALRRYFLACVAAGSGAFFTLTILATWVPQWVLSACQS
jgi:hypothetical protein